MVALSPGCAIRSEG